MREERGPAEPVRTWPTNRFLTALYRLSLIGCATFSPFAAAANDRVTTAYLDPGAVRVRDVDLPKPLPAADAERYRRIFALQRDGHWPTADAEIAKLEDKSLLGHVWGQRHLHAKWKSSWPELREYMERWADHPDARAIHPLALNRKPPKEPAPAKPVGTPATPRGTFDAAADLRPSSKASTKPLSDSQKLRSAALKVEIRRASRTDPVEAEQLLGSAEAHALFDDHEYDEARADVAEGFLFLGDDQKALVLAATARTPAYRPLAHWNAGLAAWRLQRLGEARTHFEALARLPGTSEWTRASAAYWASRVHLRARRPQLVNYWLGLAAEHPRTFYGILARRALGYDSALNFEAEAFTAAHAEALLAMPGGRRALALVQVGELTRAESEVRLLASEATPATLPGLTALADRGNMPAMSLHLAQRLAEQDGRRHDHALYPLPRWGLSEGTMVDRALLFALMRQESAFLISAESASGARGLMQLMPTTAQQLAQRHGLTLVDNSKKGREADLLVEPETNIALAQHYLAALLDHEKIGRNLFLLAASYNAGPGMVLRWPMRPEYQKDPLLFLESLPSRETRVFVQRIMTNYWIYRARLGQATPDLDQLAAGKWPTYVPMDQGRGAVRHAASR